MTESIKVLENKIDQLIEIRIVNSTDFKINKSPNARPVPTCKVCSGMNTFSNLKVDFTKVKFG